MNPTHYMTCYDSTSVIHNVFAVQKLCDPYLSASEVSFLRWGAIQISLPSPLGYRTPSPLNIPVIESGLLLDGRFKAAVQRRARSLFIRQNRATTAPPITAKQFEQTRVLNVPL